MGNTARDLFQESDLNLAIEGLNFTQDEQKNTQELGEKFESFCERLNLEELEELFNEYEAPRKSSQHEGLHDANQVHKEARLVKIYLYQSYKDNFNNLTEEQKTRFEIFQTQISVSDMVGESMNKE